MVDRIVTHPSTLNKMGCKLQYHWSRNYRSPILSEAQEFGLAMHHGLAEYYGLEGDPIKAFQAYARTHNIEKVELGIAMLENYLDHYENENFEVLATELEIARRVPIPHDEKDPPERAKHFYVAAIVDTIVRDKKLDKVFVLEHKTFDRFYMGGLARDHQFVIEAFVAEGWIKMPIAGVLYNGMRKKVEPTATTKLFERHPLYINKRTIKTMLHRVYWSLIEVTSDDFHVYPEPATMTCTYCKYKTPCEEYMRGGDWQFILDNTFEKREESEDEWVAHRVHRL